MPDSSPAQKKFLAHQKLERRLILLSRLLIFAGFLGLWESSARFGLIDSFIFSSPSRIVETFCHMWTRQALYIHIAVTYHKDLIVAVGKLL